MNTVLLGPIYYQACVGAAAPAIQLQGSSGEMRGIQEISDEIKRREEAIAKYTKALESHARVFTVIREGWMFYSSKGDPIKKAK